MASTPRYMSTNPPTDPFQLAAERNRRDIPAKVLARKLKVTRPELSFFERGDRPLPDPNRPGQPFSPTEAAQVYMAAVNAIAKFLDAPLNTGVAA